MLHGRDDLRPFAAIPRHFRARLVPSAKADFCILKDDRNAGLKARSTRDQIAAISGKLLPQLDRIRPGLVYARAARSSRPFAANSGTASHEITANSHVWNILARMQSTVYRHRIISCLTSITYVLDAIASRPLTPYPRIFCREPYTGQSLAGCPRKIFKTNDFKPHDFNILQNIVCNVLKTNIYIFHFFV